MNVDTDDQGFLLDPEDWNEDFAISIARKENIELSDDHWRIVYMIRELYDDAGTVPELRTILKHLKQSSSAENATRKYIYTLFPFGYGQQACKIAGMRLPRKLWLDV